MKVTWGARIVLVGLIITAFVTFTRIGPASWLFLIFYGAAAFLAGILLASEVVTRFLISVMGTDIQERAQELLRDPDAMNKLMGDIMAATKKPGEEKPKEDA